MNPGVEASIAPLIRSLTTRLGARLEDILLVETSSTSRLATSGRRMVSRLVPRIFAARDMRVFKHRDEAESLDTAATILMDVSGSMTSGLDDNVTCINAAAATNRSLGDVLDQFDIPFATYYFGERLTRVKGFEQRWRQRRDQHYAGTESATCTHQALGLVIPELAVRSEERKVLVVITDGMPSDVKRTVAALSEAKALGIEPAVFMVGNTNSRSTDLLAAFVADLQASGVAYSRATTASAIAEGVFAAVRSATAAH